MFDRLFRRSASVPALCVNQPVVDEEAAERLHDAERRIATLEAMLQAKVVELDQYRLLATAKAPKVSRKSAVAKAPKPEKPVKLSALKFWALHGQAVDRIRAEYGDNWPVDAPFGKTELVILPTKFRSYVNARGHKISRDKGARMPGREYWQNGVLPWELEITGDYARSADGAIPHDGNWHAAHGYAYFAGIPAIIMGDATISEIAPGWRHDLEMPALDGLRAAVLARKVAWDTLEHACLTYGPQPLVPFADIDDEMQLAEAAD